MSRVDESSQTLLISDGIRIHFTKEDVSKVFGKPSSGRSIFAKSYKLSASNAPSSSVVGRINIKQLHSIKAAQAIVDRNHYGPMSLTE